MHRLETIGTGVLRTGQAHALEADVVHSVMNRWAVPNGVVHVYAGNFLAADRHIWDPVTGERHRAGLAEPLVPVDGNKPTTTESERTSLAGTAFAALSVTDVEATSAWLAGAFGLRNLTTHDASGYKPTPITTWRFGTFTEICGPDSLKMRLFVPAIH